MTDHSLINYDIGIHIAHIRNRSTNHSPFLFAGVPEPGQRGGA